MTNPRESSVMLPIEPSEAVIEAMEDKIYEYIGTGYLDMANDIYRAIIQAHIQEQDQ